MKNSSTHAISLQRTNTAQILQLRHQGLRQGHAIAEVMFAEDSDPSSRHYGAFNEAGVNICCLSLLPSDWQGMPAWRLRAMATARSYRNQGIGSRLLQFAIDELEDDGESLPIWCNSRVSSVGFYQRFGFVEVSKPFTYGNAGSSITMLRGGWVRSHSGNLFIAETQNQYPLLHTQNYVQPGVDAPIFVKDIETARNQRPW